MSKDNNKIQKTLKNRLYKLIPYNDKVGRSKFIGFTIIALGFIMTYVLNCIGALPKIISWFK